jgi:hypothetical protein
LKSWREHTRLSKNFGVYIHNREIVRQQLESSAAIVTSISFKIFGTKPSNKAKAALDGMPLSENTSREESTETSKKRKCLAKDSKIRETPVETHSHGKDAVVLDARQKKKRKKKGHVQHDLSVQIRTKVSEAASSAKSIDIQESSTKKKKQKKRKNKRQKAHDRQSDEHENKSISDGRPVSPVLEGSMVDGMLVLIDRKAGKVYSSTAQDCNGNRIVVGILDKQVGIKLTRRNDTTNSAEDECKNQGLFKDTVRYHCVPFACIEAGLDFFLP